ncbi:ethanolamine-phosphate cytidylyltransferase-like isoform X2 [Physcomitrium patens]|uniref:ethanolamine-phosphate cytidylyltransferase-like isoform X2 n=1 Tax=Physcomitrium patens TaxID=3218 RepID=UPI003CCD8E44
MLLHERSLSVLACQYVDKIVIIGAPWKIIAFNVSMVEYGDCAEANELKYGSPNVDTFRRDRHSHSS